MPTDLEITKACAQAMGHEGPFAAQERRDGKWVQYDPLHDDAQAMALVKRFDLKVERNIFITPHTWVASWIGGTKGEAPDLNRAICECVARMAEQGKGGE